MNEINGVRLHKAYKPFLRHIAEVGRELFPGIAQGETSWAMKEGMVFIFNMLMAKTAEPKVSGDSQTITASLPQKFNGQGMARAQDLRQGFAVCIDKYYTKVFAHCERAASSGARTPKQAGAV
jgi:hypothetical protein